MSVEERLGCPGLLIKDVLIGAINWELLSEEINWEEVIKAY